LKNLNQSERKISKGWCEFIGLCFKTTLSSVDRKTRTVSHKRFYAKNPHIRDFL